MDTSSVVMCIYPHGSLVFMIVRTLILLSLAMRLTTVSLDLTNIYNAVSVVFNGIGRLVQFVIFEMLVKYHLAC